MTRPDVIILMTDQERAMPSYESDELVQWRTTLPGWAWFDEHAVHFDRHYTGSVACVPSRPTLFTGHYPDLHGVTQTDGLGKLADDSRMRWLREGEVPTLGHWFRAAGYDTHYDGKWHISHADLIGPNGDPLPTNTADGRVLEENVERYLAADPLSSYGFSGWVGPEPHGGLLADSGLVRDPLIAARVVNWLTDRYDRRQAGDPDAQRPFLLVASFVNPHDIVLFPLWQRRGTPTVLDHFEVPDVPMVPSMFEDLASKPAAQVAYRASYPSCYGPAGQVAAMYDQHHQQYRNLYYQLHAAVDQPIDMVRRTIVDRMTGDTVVVRTADHGELLGAHGGLHQKWFQLYDEATRVPFSIARLSPHHPAPQSTATPQSGPQTGSPAGSPSGSRCGRIDQPTSHVDLVPTLLGAIGADEDALASNLSKEFTEVHPLPGENLMPFIDGDAPASAGSDRVVYLMTRDDMPEGDTGASGAARLLGRSGAVAGPLRISVPAWVATNIEAVVCRVDDTDAAGGRGHLWKLVRTFDDPSCWTEPDIRQLASDGLGGPTYRTEVLPDQWELYNLTVDPGEVDNRVSIGGEPADETIAAVVDVLTERLKVANRRSVPQRHQPWPYATSKITKIGKVPLLPPGDVVRQRVGAQVAARIAQRRATQPRAGGGSGAETTGPRRPPGPARALRTLARRVGLHPEDHVDAPLYAAGKKALLIATNHGQLDIGKPTGLFASELTVAYYAFLDAGMFVDVASPLGGNIPIDPLSLKPIIRTNADDRLLGDPVLRGLLTESLAIADVDIVAYDLVFLAGGWGAAFDFATSDSLATQISLANRAGAVIGGVCHGPLGLVNATDVDGSRLVAGRRLTAVTDKQVDELGITATPYHPETELRQAGALFEAAHARRDVLANHFVVDGNLVTGQNQNAAPMVARMMMEQLRAPSGPNLYGPDIANSDIANSDIGSPDIGSPDIGSPDTANSDIGSPDTDRPHTNNAATQDPDAKVSG